MSTTETLNATQAAMIAASLEIDGRVDRAAGSIYFQDELSYANAQPFSTKAKALAALQQELTECIETFGTSAVIRTLRSY